jgi:predicted DNA-binding transcriptional regulator AlpA
MMEPSELWPEFAAKTVSDLARAVGQSRQALWQAINAGRIPAPMKLAPRVRVYPPKTFDAIVAQIQSGAQDRETQRVMKAQLRVRAALAKAKAKAARLEAKLAALEAAGNSLTHESAP